MELRLNKGQGVECGGFILGINVNLVSDVSLLESCRLHTDSTDVMYTTLTDKVRGVQEAGGVLEV